MGFFSDLFGSVAGNGNSQTQSAFQHDQNEADAAQNNGAALQSQFGTQYGLQNANAYNYGNQAATAYSDLAANPGYSASDAAAIKGNPNAAFNYYNPSQLEGDTSAYQGALTGAAQSGDQELQAAPDNETSWQGGINSALQNSGSQAVGELQNTLAPSVSGYGSNLNSALGTEGQSLNGAVNTEGQQLGQAVSGEGQGLGAAVDEYGGNLNSAVNPANLTVTPEQQQAIRNQAAQATSGQYQKMSAQAQQSANAQGNTSPAALAAIQENIGRQGAIDAGNAATSAEIGANQLALGAHQQLAGLQSQNATNLYGAQSGASEALANQQANAAEAEGAAQQGAASTLGSAQTNAAGNYYGAQSGAANSIYGAQSGTAQNLASTETGANENIAGTQANAASQEANLGYNAAQQGGAQQIATDTGLQSTGQTLATNADNAASNRATTTANQTQTGMNNLRNYYTGEQSTALNAGATAGQQQLGAYGTQTSGVNAANSSAGNVATGTNAASGGAGATGAISAGLGALAALADGGTVTGDPSGYSMDSDDFGADGMGDGNTDYSATPTPATPVQNSTVSKYRNAVRGLAGIVSPQFATTAQQPTAGASQQQAPGSALGNNLNSIGASLGTLASKLADGGTRGSGTPALIAERGPEAVVTKYANGGTVQPMPYRPQAAQPQPDPQQPQQNPMRGDGSSVPGNEPGGAQGQQGWRGNAANQMAAGSIGGAPPQQTQVFTRPTNVMLGNNGAADTVVPLNPGPNAKVLPSQMGMAAQSSPYRQPQQGMPQQQPPDQTQARMPSRYRPATGPKGLVGPQQPMQPYQSNPQQGQYSA